VAEDNLNDYGARFGLLEERLRPIARRRRLPPNPLPPLDEAGVRAEAESLLTGVTALYVVASEEHRAAIRELFRRHRSVSWALWPRHKPLTEEHFRSWILAISMKDQGRDPRDTLVRLWHICCVAAEAGVTVRPLLDSIASISGDEDHYGMGTMRAMLRNAPPRFKPRPADC
jgi:hypothetical protein